MVRPGELNLMTGGYGVAHSEVSTRGTTSLHGVQLWVALPDHAPTPAPGLHPPRALGGPPRRFHGARTARHARRPHLPGRHAHPLLGAELVLAPGAELTLDVAPDFEHGVLVDTGPVSSTAPSWSAPRWATCRPVPTG